MNLRRRAHLVVLIALVIVIGLCGVFLTVRFQKAQVEQEILLIDGLIIDSIHLRSGFIDYLLYREDRPRRQVEAQFADLHAVLENQAEFFAADIKHEPLTQILWENVRRLLAESETLFAELVNQEPALRLERNRRTTDLLLLNGQSLLFTVSQLHRIAINELLETHNQEETTLWILLAGLAGLGLSLFLLLQKGVLAPLQQLREAAIRIAGGQADLRLHSPRRDEFGQLAQAFDHMLDQLQETTVSRDRLEVEIGERRQAEAALRESEERLQLFIEHAPAALAMFDREMRYIGVSRRWMTDYGLGDQEIIGRSHYEIFPEIPDRWKTIHQRGLAGEVIQANDDSFVRTDGAVQWLRWVVRPWYTANGAVGGIVIFTEDITEWRQAQTEIHRLNTGLEERVRQRTAELVAANQELDSFAYAVSHDLRAPLRAMSGFSQALLEDYGEGLNGEARIYLDQIMLSSHRMSELIDGLLVLSRSTRGEMRRERVDLTALVERLRAELSAAEPERPVVWQVEPVLSVQGDPIMLEVVMRNLIDNAWKYTARTPNATIRVYSEHDEGDRGFCVADNGAGFDMSHASRLFKAFQRLHRQDEFPGIGIGLATVQRIIHRHGGVIRAEGAPGRGATFHFTLPGAETPQEETS